jgi:hypothetical protein
MKGLKVLNTFALAVPISIAMIGLFDEEYFIMALVSTMITGFMQLVIGILFWLEFPSNRYIKLYFLIVTAFFILLFSKATNDWYWCLPPVLCVYLSVLIYTKK